MRTKWIDVSYVLQITGEERLRVSIPIPIPNCHPLPQTGRRGAHPWEKHGKAKYSYIRKSTSKEKVEAKHHLVISIVQMTC